MAETVYYWRGSTEVRNDLIAGLAAKSYDVVQLRTLDEILDRIDSDECKLILVDGSGGDREASQRVIELANTPKLYPVPIVFVSANAEKRVEALEGNYIGVLPINIPYRMEAVIAGACYVLENPNAAEEAREVVTAVMSEVERLKDVVSQNNLAEAQDSESPTEIFESEEATAESLSDSEGAPPGEPAAGEPAAGESTEGADSEPTVVRRRPLALLPENTEAIRRRMAGQSDPANLGDSRGGVAFALARHPDDFHDETLFPEVQGDVSISQLLESLAEEDSWLASHSKRVAFVSSATANSLDVDEERDRVLRIASLFLNWSLRDRPLNLMRHNLILNPSNDVQNILGESYLQSASFIEERFGEGRAAETIRVLAGLLRGEQPIASPEILRDAQTVLGVELCARSCWALGFWDPYGAYRAIRYFRSQRSIITDESVKAAVAKMLGEAVTSHVTVGNSFVSHLDDADADSDLISRRRKDDAASQQAMVAAAERIEKEGFTKVSLSISDLAPGMLLAAPVLARDGRLVLEANIVLSEDIVLDLWQLAAIRALNGKVDVAVKDA